MSNYKCSKCGKGKGEIAFLLNEECQKCGWGKGKEFCSSCFKEHELALQEHRKICEQKPNKPTERERERESKIEIITFQNYPMKTCEC